VTERGSIEFNELIRLTGLDQQELTKVIGILFQEHAIETHGSLITALGELKLPPVEEWRGMTIDKVFDEVAKYCILVRSPDLIAQALQVLKDNVEEKVRSRGTFIFDIGKEIQQWKKGAGNMDELQFRLRDWKSRVSR
jgi:hypothetical protein